MLLGSTLPSSMSAGCAVGAKRCAVATSPAGLQHVRQPQQGRLQVLTGACCAVQGFGKFSRVAYPGCNCLNPCCGEVVAGQLSLRVQQLEVRCETKTKDNVFITLMISVMYQVKRVLLYEDGPPPAAVSPSGSGL